MAIFPHCTRQLRGEIESREQPRERMYGLLELGNLDNVEIHFSDSRFKGLYGKFVSFCRKHGFNPIDLNTAIEIARADLVVLKDDFSFSASLVAKLTNTPMVCYDSLFPLPKNSIKKYLIRICIRWSDKIITYSKHQAKKYSLFAGVPIEKFEAIEFVLDNEFYKTTNPKIPTRPYVLSIGRDTGRDFETLARACALIDLNLKLVTLPYLVKDSISNSANIEIYQNISYSKLFELYSGSTAIVVPLKEGLDYASGIRAILEAITLNRPVIVSETDYVKANIKASSVIKFVKPENVSDLAEKLKSGFPNIKKSDFIYLQDDYISNVKKITDIILSSIK